MKKILTLFISMILVFSLFCACDLKDKLNGTDSDGKKYQKYVKGLMDGSYKGDINAYMSVCDASKSDAEKNYDDCMLYYVRSLLYSFGFEDYTIVPKDLLNRYTEFVKKAINEAKYSVDKGKKDGKEWSVTIHVSPLNIFGEKAMDDLDSFVSAEEEKYKDADWAGMTDADYDNFLNEYLGGILDILEKNFDDREYKDEVEMKLDIKISNKTYSIDDSKWGEVDNLIFNLVRADESAN